MPDPDDFDDADRPGRRREGAGRTWASRPARRCARSRSTPCSSAPAPTAGSRTCALAAEIIEGRHVADGHPDAGRPRLGAGAPAGRGRGPRRDLQGGRRRVARRRLLDVPRHEPRHRSRPASAARRRPTATSRAGRARAVAPTWSRSRSPPRPRSAAPSPRPPTSSPCRQERLTWTSSPATPASASRCAAATSTPTRSSRRSTSSGSPAPASRTACSRPGATTRRSCSTTPAYAGGSVLVAGPDFGTGSSREHAVWALQNYGFKVVISPALRRHLPRQLRQGRPARGAGRREGRRSGSGTSSRTSPAPTSPSTSSRARCAPARVPDAIEDSFDIDDYTRWRLLEGLDDIGITPRARGPTSRPTRRPGRAGSPSP